VDGAAGGGGGVADSDAGRGRAPVASLAGGGVAGGGVAGGGAAGGVVAGSWLGVPPAGSVGWPGPVMVL
jgi:hypothetical protein